MARPRTKSNDAILEATRAVLLERGPSAPVSAMARRAGLSAPAVLGRFGSRAALVQAALTPPSLLPVLLILQREPEPDRFRDQLAEVLRELGAWLERALPCQLLAAIGAPGSPSPSRADDSPRLQPSLTIWLARAQARGALRAGDPQRLSTIVLNTLRGHAASSLLAEPTSGPTLDDQVVTLVSLLTGGSAHSARR
jgi:AcrR family transcriptional regulator